MQISMIAAMANGRVIGSNNAMPWHLSADLKHFKQTTLGKPIVMGRKTYESIGKALPGRLNIVISADPECRLKDASVVNSCEKAIEVAERYFIAEGIENAELMIVGGGSIYQHFLEQCHKLYLTEIDLSVEGDTFFPDYQAAYNWLEVDKQAFAADQSNPYNYQFITLVKQALSA